MKKNTSAKQETVILTVMNALIRGFGLLLRVILSRLLGAEVMGISELAGSVHSLAITPLSSGLPVAISRMTAKAKKEHESLSLLAGISIVRIFSLVMMPLLLLFSPLIAQWLGDERVLPSLWVTAPCILVIGYSAIYNGYCYGIEQTRLPALSELLEQVVRIGATMALLYAFPQAGLGEIAVLIFAGMVISECVSAFTMWRMYGKLKLRPHVTPPQGYRKEFFGIVIPVSCNALLINAVASADIAILPERLVQSGLSYEDALAQMGIVSGIASPILFLPMALVASLVTVAMPEISRFYATGNADRTAVFAEKALIGAGLIGIPATAMLLPLSPMIARLFFFQAVETSTFYWLGLSVVLIYYQMLTGCLLNGTGHQQFAVMTALTSEILQLALVWFLAKRPTFGVTGYLLAMCVAPCYVAVCNTVHLLQLGILRAHPARWLRLPLLCGATVFLWTRIFLSFGMDWLGNQWLALTFALGSASILYVILLRAFGIKIEQYLSIRSRDTANMFLFY